MSKDEELKYENGLLRWEDDGGSYLPDPGESENYFIPPDDFSSRSRDVSASKDFQSVLVAKHSWGFSFFQRLFR